MQQPIRPGLYLGRDGTIRRVEEISCKVYFRHGFAQTRDTVTYSLVNRPERPVQRRTVLETTFQRWTNYLLASVNQKIAEQLTLDGWEIDFADPQFQQSLARENLVEDFLNTIDEHMQLEDVSHLELAQRMGCSMDRIQQLMDRTAKLTAEVMVDMAFCLGLKVKLQLEKM